MEGDAPEDATGQYLAAAHAKDAADVAKIDN